MAEPRAKVFHYAAEVTADGEISVPGHPRIGLPREWSPDDLVLAALVRCSIESLSYHARRAGSTVRAKGSATGTVTKRKEDGRFGFVEIDCRIEAELTPPLPDTAELVAKAERDCFVGASLTPAPRYDWRLT